MTRMKSTKDGMAPLTAEQNARRDAEEAAFAEAAPKNLILRKIAKLEAQQTPRRLAEAILTDDGKTWLQSNRDLIQTELDKL